MISVRGLIAHEQGKYAQAVDDLSEAIKLSMFNSGNYMRRGQAYEKLGQKALAMADYTAAVELNVPTPAQRDARVIARERLGVLQGETIAAQQPTQTQQQQQKPQPVIDLGRRIALVIGVGAYKNAPGLRNPPNDAAAVAKALRELGFVDVTEVLDPTRASLEAALMTFGDKAAEADWSVIFYAGHGMQVDGRNFLIPTDAKLDSDRHVNFETVVLDRVIESMNGTKKLGLVILDACRDNPFLKRMRQTRSVRSFGQGLAAVRTEPRPDDRLRHQGRLRRRGWRRRSQPLHQGAAHAYPRGASRYPADVQQGARLGPAIDPETAAAVYLWLAARRRAVLQCRRKIG